MPASVLPPLASMFEISTWRSYCLSQLPHERYSLPNSSTWKFEMLIVPGPLCWNTLSFALRAPPQLIFITCDDELPFSVAASSPTSSHHTFSSVQLPLQ